MPGSSPPPPGPGSLEALDAEIAACRACPRLVSWREEVAATKRAAFQDETYWGAGVPGFGPADARIAIVGLAPAAHGANRTGRIFTGDRSGDWLYAALHRVGLANQATSVHADDGLELHGTRIMAAVRCAPPANKPTPLERDTCREFLIRELALLDGCQVVVTLGQFGWTAVWPALAQLGHRIPRPRAQFGHGVEVTLAAYDPGDYRDNRHVRDPGAVTVLGCYHVSQQNTFTGVLTEPMLDAVLLRARELAGLTRLDP